MHSEIKSFMLSFILIAVLPNIALVVLAAWLDLGRPYVNLDYLLAAVLMFTKLRWLGMTLFVVFFATDVLALLAQIFQFIRLDNLIYLSKFVLQAPSEYQFSILGIFALFFCLTVLFWHIPKLTNAKHALVMLNIGLMAYGVYVYSDSTNTDKLWRLAENHVVGSPTLHTIEHRSRGFLQTFNMDGPAFSGKKPASATALWQEKGLQPAPKMLLVVSESWGVPVNTDVQKQLLAPLARLGNKILWQAEGELQFHGATVAGELREICNLSPNHFNLRDVTEGFDSCLPNYLRANGYHTSALHGASGVLYDRIYWYPRAGFDEITFFENKVWERRCYSYPGACDFEAIKVAEAALAQPGKQFFYWLTLNSHAIYDLRDLVIDVFDCNKYAIPDNSQVCRNLKLQAQFFFSLSQSIEAGNFAGVEVIIVGDHDPIITNLEEKTAHFADNKVPWVKFSVRDNVELLPVLHNDLAPTDGTRAQLSL